MNGRALARTKRKKKNRKQIWQANDGMSTNGFIKIISQMGWGEEKKTNVRASIVTLFFSLPWP